jgi:hypothetical protein
MPYVDEDTRREAAEQVNATFPDWLVLWGPFSQQFVAFPLFRAPRGTVLASHDISRLERLMRQTRRTIRCVAGLDGGYR